MKREGDKIKPNFNMRIEVSLISLGDNFLSLNYNHSILGLIYRIISTRSNPFAREIHERGYRLNGKVFRMFTFSKIFYFGDSRVVNKANIFIPINSEISFFVSSPSEEFMKNFAIGLTMLSQVWIEKRKNIYIPKSVEIVFEPEVFRGEAMEIIEVDGVFISPLVVSKVDSLGRKVFLSCLDEEIPRLIRNNLFEKFEAFYKCRPDDEFEFEFKFDYIAKGKWSKLVTLKGGSKGETKVRCMLAPFRIRGTRRIVKFAWDVGLGEKNSMGFGMWDLAKPRTNGNILGENKEVGE